MSSTAPALEISAPKVPIPTCSPQLMPFHISYTGPAPVSTYFRVKPASKPDYGAAADLNQTTSSLPTTDSQSTLVEESQPAEGTSQLSLQSTSTTTLTPDVDMTTEQEPNDTSNHLVAAFRGRTVRGLKVDLPPGYSGVILTPADASATKANKANESKQASTYKRASRGAKSQIDEDEKPDLAELADALDEAVPVRTLQASSTFSSFVLWNADRPVDDGRDEYLRSLTEWTKLSAMINDYTDT
ncbi:hypothetical protein BDW22DRAFT_1361090 [Trametopsis cervina]|nr:hypothetical protein BDW22DRAFT_1361090 [Trametopsis cervina]